MSKLRRLLPSPNALFVFEVAARTLNFKLAGAELNVTQPSVSQTINALERFFGVKLFHRDNRGVRLTEAGRVLYDGVKAGFGQIETSIQEIKAQVPRSISVAASTALAAHWLIPKLPAFHATHPDIKIKLLSTDRDIEPAGDVHMTIWLRDQDFSHPYAWKLSDERIFPVCSPLYLSGLPKMAKIPDLAHAKLLHWSDDHRYRMGWPEWLERIGAGTLPMDASPHFNDYQLVLQAAMAGEGMALGWSMATQWLRQRNLLVQPLREELRTGKAHFLICDERAMTSPQIKALIDWIIAQAAADI